MNTDALFVRDGESYVAGELTLGPWAPGALHGGPPAALIAHEVSRHAPEGLRLARITLDLVRSVPLGTLSLEIATVRPGRRVTLLDATLRDIDGVEVTRARSLFLVASELDATPAEPPPFPGPEDSTANDWEHPTPMFATRGMEIRFARGAFRAVGPATAWFRLAAPLIAGEPTLGIDRIVAAADFGNGIAPAVPWEGHTFINPDLTVFVEREPVDEWVALEAVTRVQRGSAAIAESTIWDRHGRIGRAVQTLLVARTT
jgi:hypothetical protein